MPDSNDQVRQRQVIATKFAIIPEWLLYHPTISPGAVRLYGALQRHANQEGAAWPGQERLGALLSCDTRTIRRWTAELELAGAVVAHQRRNQSQVYVLRLDRTDMTSPDSGTGQILPVATGQECPPNENQGTRTSNTRVHPAFEAEFETWWTLYPRKKERKAALSKYQATRRRGATPEELLTAVTNYAAHVRREDTEERYIKHGATFLGPNEPWRDYLAGVPDGDVETGVASWMHGRG